ncbi:MAG: hypothetical protein ACRERC_17085 [Candidatus Binatia bacterium]
MVSDDAARRQRVPLVVISLIAAAPMVYMAIHHRIDFDGWWHVFIAREVPWGRFWADVYRNAHPPSFYLLLRAAAWLGSDRLVYRAVSIVAAVVATYLIGRIAARVVRTPAVSLLCALTFGLAMTTVIMACAVRSYMVSVALMLVAFRLYLDLIDPRRERLEARTRVWFVVALIAAILTHYSAVFLAVAAAALPCLYAAVDRPYRRWWGGRLRTGWRGEFATIVPILAVVVAVYVVHTSTFDAPMNFAAQFYPDQAELAAGLIRGGASFVSRSLVAEIDLFGPLPIAALPAATRAVVVSLLGVLAAGLAVILRRRADWVVAAAPLATLAILATAMMGAALIGRYPFGGFLRHQFILFPFIVLSGFALLDELVARSGHRRIVLLAVCAAVLLNAVLQWQRMPFTADEPFAEEAVQFDRILGHSRAVYADQYSAIHFFAAHQRDAWSAPTELRENFFAIPVRGSGRTLLVVRDLTRWSCDVSDPLLYRDLREVIELTGLPAVDLFRLAHDAQVRPALPRAERARLAESVVELAASEDLRVERLVLDGHHVYARFRLDGETPAGELPTRF